MICPKCGFEQPESPECMRCGVIISRYKGPVTGATPPQPIAVPPPPLPLSGNETVRILLPPPPPPPTQSAGGTVYGGPGPAAAPAGIQGTVYGGPVPAPAGGGTVYGGPPAGPPPGIPAGAVLPTPAFGLDQHRFGVGNILSQTFSVYFANFLPFALLTALALAPVYLLEGYSTAPVMKAGQPSLTAFSPVLMVLAVTMVCRYFATAAITYGVFQQMRGMDSSIGACLAQGLSSLLPIVGLAIVQGIAIGFGLVACVVPGILLSLIWAVSIPAAVTERVGIGEALSRSVFLTRGMRGDIFSTLFVLGLLQIAMVLLVNLAAARNHALHVVLLDLNAMFSVGLSATASAVMYYRLRSIKESIDVDQIASVFA
jgi:hypothetical protein